MNGDEQVAAIRPTAVDLCTAVDRGNHNTVAAILHGLDRQQLYALAVVLAANVDLPLVDGKRRHDEIDEIRVRRILDGDMALCAEVTTAERRAVVMALQARGWTKAAIASAHGWTAATVAQDVTRVHRQQRRDGHERVVQCMTETYEKEAG